jgi:hypothetical protein
VPQSLWLFLFLPPLWLPPLLLLLPAPGNLFDQGLTMSHIQWDLYELPLLLTGSQWLFCSRSLWHQPSQFFLTWKLWVLTCLYLSQGDISNQSLPILKDCEI